MHFLERDITARQPMYGDVGSNVYSIAVGGNQTGAQTAVVIVLAARRRAPLEEVADAIQRAGGTAHCPVFDVADSGQVEAALGSIAQLGTIDVLVNNAGTAAGSSLPEMDEETLDQVLNVNLRGAWLVARATAKRMIAANIGGSIVNVSSVLGSAVQKGTANYPAAKAALTHLTRSMALEWARFGIRVNALVPGYLQPTSARPISTRREAMRCSSACPRGGSARRRS